jgi:hypothetical protein
MSMIAMFRLARGEEIERLLASPEAIEEFLEEDPDSEEEGEDPGGSLDIDKAWHGLHFLLTGTAWEGTSPLDFIVAGARTWARRTWVMAPRGHSGRGISRISRAPSSPSTRRSCAGASTRPA